MGFRYRKSINLGGGFRINLSKSGIGYSWGTKGYRVTKKANGGIRKTYSIPGTGISWVEDSGNPAQKRKLNSNENNLQQPVLYKATGANTLKLNDNNTKEFMDAINKYSQIHGKLKWGSIISFLVALVVPQSIILFLIFLIGLICHTCTSKIQLEYGNNEHMLKRMHKLDITMAELVNSIVVWQIVSRVANASVKINAGAVSSVDRKKVKFIKRKPYFLKTDGNCYSVKFQNDTVFFLPDAILIKDRRGWGVLEYQNLNIGFENQIFIENESVPQDANVVGNTWKYVNKHGGPDRRYKNNNLLPMCEYGSIVINFGTALNVQLFVSSSKRAERFFNKINEIIEDAKLIEMAEDTYEDVNIDNSIEINEKKASISRVVSVLQSIKK